MFLISTELKLKQDHQTTRTFVFVFDSWKFQVGTIPSKFVKTIPLYGSILFSRSLCMAQMINSESENIESKIRIGL